VTPFQGKGSNVKKLLTALLMGAFLFVSVAAIGCSETKVEVKEKDKADKKDKDK